MITSEAISSAARAAAEPCLVESESALDACVQVWREHSVLGIDTEFVRERTFRADLGLMQISDGVTAWLIDPVALDCRAVSSMLEDDSITKIFHSASEDLEVLWLTFSVSPAPLADTQVACAMLGQSLQLSYGGAVRWLCGIEVDKEQTRSNWLKRPLKSEQLHYAACDVVYLPLLFRELKSRLDRLNRWDWVLEDIEYMRRQSQAVVEPTEAYLRIRGSGRLDQSDLRILQALAQWREETAMGRNLARNFVLSDSSLLQIATRQPQSIQELGEIAGLHPSAVRKFGHELTRVIGIALRSTETLRALEPLDKQQKRQLEAMRAQVRKKADSLGIDPALLASRKVLESLIRSHASGMELPERLMGWRKEVVTDDLLAILSIE